MFDAETVAAIRAVATTLHIDPAALLAIAEVESGGQPFALVKGRKEPLIRFEGHYFDRRLSGKDQAKARSLGLSSPTAGAIANPRTQAGRWTLLDSAVEINAQAAFESCSWGVGQVMGAHWKWLGFNSVTELVNLCRRDVAGQAELMARYIDKAGLGVSLREKDWTAFARGYNGPSYKKNGYHTKIEAAYKRYAGTAAAQPAATPPVVPVPPTKPKPEPLAKSKRAAYKRYAGTAAAQPAATPPVVPVPPTKPKPEPLAKSKRFWTWVMTGIGAPLAAFGALDWRVQFFIVAVIVGFAIYAISAMPQVRKALGLS